LNRRICGILAAAAAVIALLPDEARAQWPGSAEAEELFKQGRAALESHQYQSACMKLAQSLELEAAVGTLISLAECEQAQGQLAAARQHWREAAGLAEAKNDPLHREGVARQNFIELDRRVPRLEIRLAEGAPKDAVLQRDDVFLGTGSFDVPLPIDSGSHVITIRAPSRQARQFSIDLKEGDRKTLQVEPGPPEAAAAPAPASDGISTAPAPDSNRIRGGQRRTVAYVIGGLGGAGLAVGTIFGLTSFAQWSEAKTDCGAAGCAAGSSARNAADREKAAAVQSATVSTIAFAASATALVAGLVLWLSAPVPARARTSTELVARPVAIGLGGQIAVEGSW
jgi:hypothetical protein